MSFDAFAHIEKKEYKQAEEKLSYLLNVNPDAAVLYYYLGCLFLEKKQYAFAVLAYEKAVALVPLFDECFNNMSTAYRQLGRMDKCKENFKKAVDIAKLPDYVSKFPEDPQKAKQNLADYLGNLGSCYVAGGTSQTAIDYENEALALIPDLPNARWNRSLALLELGDYAQGFDDYNYCEARTHPTKERSYHGAPNSTPWWDGKPGKKIVVYGEQGLGDEIMFASILPDIMKDCEVVFECHPRLMNLFRSTWPKLTIYGTRKATQLSWAKSQKDIQEKTNIAFLASKYRRKKEDFPGMSYLIPDGSIVEKMKKRLDSLGSRPKIGLSWKGGIGITNKEPRTIDLSIMLPLFDFDVDFISLQYHKNALAERDKFWESTGKEIVHWQDVIDDYDLTAGLVANLDLIISVPQSVVHLAGAIGAPVLQLCPVRALWQMGVYGEDAPWYKSVANIWQDNDGNWPGVIAKVVTKLKELEFKCL